MLFVQKEATFVRLPNLNAMTDRQAELIGLIHKEVKPALGCTEPIAVALAVAKAVDIISENCTRCGDCLLWR